jgi:anaerobic selenocysteine-containing dehydrogenase
MIRPSDAEKMGVHKGDMLKVTVKDKTVTGPVWITPNQAQGSVAPYSLATAGPVPGVSATKSATARTRFKMLPCGS